MRAALTATLARHRTHTGSRYYYRPGKDPLVRVHVDPAHAGDCVTVRTQLRRHGRWTRTQNTCVVLSATSSGRVVVTRAHPDGTRIRLRTLWAGDARNVAARTPWSTLIFG
ncbi:MAG: hypothetical protein R2731_12270 [Nocardioides sp.]